MIGTMLRRSGEDERREARMKRVAPAEWKAASMLANAYRGKRAREANYRKWSLSHEGAR